MIPLFRKIALCPFPRYSMIPSEADAMAARSLERRGVIETSWSFYRLNCSLTRKGEALARKLSR